MTQATKSRSPQVAGPKNTNPATTKRTTPKKAAPAPALVSPGDALNILRTPLRTDLLQRDDEPSSFGEAVESGSAQTGTGASLDIVNADAFKTDLSSGDEMTSISGGSVGTELGGAGLSLYSAITGFFLALSNCYKQAKAGEAENAVGQGLEGVLKAGDLVKAAITIAEKGGGAEIAKAVMPGLDLAFSIVSLIGNIGSLYRLHTASSAEGKALTAAEAKDANLATALGTIHARTLRKLALTWVQTAGDVVMIVGSIAQLAAGPWGTVVKLAGGIVKIIGAAAGVIAEHFEAKATRAARDEYNQAMLSGDEGRKKEAVKTRLSKDAMFAVQEMLVKGTTVTPGTTDIAPEMKTLFASYGLGPAFLKKWSDAKVADGVDGGPQQKALLAYAEDLILRFVGASKDPKTLSESILGGLNAVWSWFKGITGLASTPTQGTATPLAITKASEEAAAPILLKYADKKAKTGANGIKPIVLTNELADAYKKLVATYTNGLTDEAAKAEKLNAIDLGITAAIRKAHLAAKLGASFPISTLVVRRGIVFFAFPYPPVPQQQPPGSGGPQGVPQPQNQPQPVTTP